MTGRSIHQYQILEKLGAGGMGEVFKAQDTRLNRFVAVKQLPAAKSGDPSRRRRFVQEAQAASALNHPNIITIYDIISDAETDSECMVIEYIDGKTLIDVIPNGGLRVPQALKYSVQIADALCAAHAAGIIHRDLKPGNVMVTGSGLVKILDFGLAKITGGGPVSQSDATVSMAGEGTLTVEGSIIGTLSYMSPEQAQGKKVDARSDIFSFGCLLYEMVTGRRAFEGDSAISTLTAVLRDESRPISEIAPDVPDAFIQIVHRCLRKDPEQRYQTMTEVQADLTSLKRQSDSGVLYKSQIVPPPPPAPAKAGSSKTLIGVAAAVALVAAGVGGWWFTSHRGGPPPEPVPAPPAAVATPVPAPAPEPAPAEHGDVVLNNDSILEMVQAKVPVSVILTHIRASKTAFDLSTAGVIKLTKGGVPDTILQMMHNPKSAPPATITAGAPKSSAPTSPTSPAPKNAPAASPASVASTAPPAAIAPSVATPPPSAPVTPAPPAAPRVAAKVAVKDALPLRITLTEDIATDAEVGQALRFTATNGLSVGDTVVIPKGAVVAGEIAETAKKKFLGKGTRMSFRLQKIDSVEGGKLDVRATPSRRADASFAPVDNGKGGKSKEVAAVKGAEYVAYIDGDQTVTVHK